MMALEEIRTNATSVASAISAVVQNSSVFAVANLTCSNVALLPVAEQCRFAKAACAGSRFHIGLVDYISAYYCLPWRFLAIAGLAAAIIAYFVWLALAASDFLCPNLYSISKFLDLSDNVAGLTLLALGNGSADVVLTYKALDIGATNLAVLELVGAAFFILTVVVGAISIACPFKVPRFAFVRDTSFYLIITFNVTLVLALGRISYATSIVIFTVYVVYVLVVVNTHAFLASNPLFNNLSSDSGSLVDIDALVEDESRLELDEFDAFLKTHAHCPQDERAPVETGPYGLRVLLKELSKHSIYLDITRPPHIYLGDAAPLTAHEVAEGHLELAPTRSSLPATAEILLHTVLRHAVTPNINETLSVGLKAYIVISYPIDVLFKLTTPNREQAIEYGKAAVCNAFTFDEATSSSSSEGFEDFNPQADMLMYRVQLALAPATFTLINFHHHPTFLWWFPAVVGGSLATSFVYAYHCLDAPPGLRRHQFWNYLGALMGFMLSLLWILVLVGEIVAILKAATVAYVISDDIIGATAFALGNSVGDLVLNLTIARMGMPLMAFGACFGGPLLAISSLGLSAIIIMSKKKLTSIPVHFSITMKLNCFAVIACLTVLAVWIPRKLWNFDRNVGVFLILAYAVTTSTAIYLEMA